MSPRNLDIEKVAAAIVADAEETLPELRQALAEAQMEIGRRTTPEQMLVRQARETPELSQELSAA